MSTAYIVNAAPMFIARGVLDNSTRALVREPEALPTHLPKQWLYTKTGPEYPVLVGGAERAQVFHADSFDLRKKWANHSTVFSNNFTKAANAQMIQRIVPADAGPAANFLLSLDIIADQIDDFERNLDGSIKLDVNDDPIILGQIPGFKCKWVVTSITDQADMVTDFGQAVTVAGDQTAGTGPGATTSTRIPVLEFRCTSRGEAGNHAAISIWAPTTKSQTPLDQRILQRGTYYPYRISVSRRPNATSSAKSVTNLFGEQYVDFALEPGAINPINDASAYLGNADVFLDKYQNVKDVNYPPLLGDFDTVAIYKENIVDILEMLYPAEAEYHETENIADSDFVGITGEEYKYNLFGGTTSTGYKYHTVQWLNPAGSVTLSEVTKIYAAGGSDGTMNDTLFAAAVSAKALEYNDPNSEVLDDAWNVESHFYDSGYPLQTKKDLVTVTAIRKDTMAILSCFEAGGPKLTASQENSMAITLRSYAEMFPDSEYYNTGVCRVLIMGRDGLIRSSNWDERVPVTFSLATKSAEYMGASNGIWQNDKRFDGEEGSIITDMYDINVVYTPPGARNRDWDAGLNWVQRYDRRAIHFPALKTVYSNDTSVLTGYLTVCAVVESQKVLQRAWRHFTGTHRYTNAQLAQRVNAWVLARLRGRFDNRFVFEAATNFSLADQARGYSFTTNVTIFAPNMKTVMTTFVETRRIEDLEDPQTN